MKFSIPRRTFTPTAVLSFLILATAGSTGMAQNGGSELTRLKAAYLADLSELEKKFTGLAEAFPADKYAWRPMPGVRSVAQVLGLLAAENYLTLIPTFGGKAPADVPAGKDAWEKFEAITDRTQLVRYVKESFDLARRTITGWSGNPEAPIELWGEKRSLPAAFMTVMADQHEHLGQLIAYARMNQIAPPWSR